MEQTYKTVIKIIYNLCAKNEYAKIAEDIKLICQTALEIEGDGKDEQ